MKNRIWLTGDVHHMTMNGHDQKLMSQKGIKTTEVELCEQYLEISNQYGFEPTLFFTGKSVEEEGDKIKELIPKYKFSIGGHTYSAYQPKILSRISSKLYNSPYLTYASQKNDIIKTKKIIKDRLGIEIKFWRNHGYHSDKYTNNILDSLNFKYVSNEINQHNNYEQKIVNNLISRPINTLPDHENMLHSTEHKGGISSDKWISHNIIKVEKIIENKGLANLLLHPLCMFLEDDFNSMVRLLSAL